MLLALRRRVSACQYQLSGKGHKSHSNYSIFRRGFGQVDFLLRDSQEYCHTRASFSIAPEKRVKGNLPLPGKVNMDAYDFVPRVYA